MKKKILISHPWTVESIPHLSDFVKQLEDRMCEVVFFPDTATMSEADIVKWIPGCYAHVCGGVQWTAKAMESAPDLKIIARIGVGYETVDIPAATARGIAVTTTPGAGAETVSEFAFGMIMALSRAILRNDRIVRKGGWKSINGPSIYRKTLGIVGFGLIGRQLAKWARGFDMKVVAFDPVQDSKYAADNGIRYLPLDRLLAESDYVSLHLPFTPDSKNLIGEKELSLMKPSAFLVNAARGGIVDEKALYDALKKGALAGAALDVFDKEPVSMDNPLLSLDNVIVAPHMAGSSLEGLDSIFGAATRNVLELMDGKVPHGIRNPEVFGKNT